MDGYCLVQKELRLGRTIWKGLWYRFSRVFLAHLPTLHDRWRMINNVNFDTSNSFTWPEYQYMWNINTDTSHRYDILLHFYTRAQFCKRDYGGSDQRIKIMTETDCHVSSFRWWSNSCKVGRKKARLSSHWIDFLYFSCNLQALLIKT